MATRAFRLAFLYSECKPRVPCLTLMRRDIEGSRAQDCAGPTFRHTFKTLYAFSHNLNHRRIRPLQTRAGDTMIFTLCSLLLTSSSKPCPTICSN